MTPRAPRSRDPLELLLLGAWLALLLLLGSCSGNSGVSTAVNITWSSINFKTLLLWEPEPTNYVYTVEIDGQLSDRKKACIHTRNTECDVTNLLKNVKDSYVARIYSEVPYQNDDYNTPPYEVSPSFTPYAQTEIGIPTIKQFEQIDKTLIIEILDPLTPYRFENGSFQTIRDVFKDDLEYTVYYWKDQSSGKKWSTKRSNQFELNVDEGENYCFYVQATVRSNSKSRDSPKSMDRCTSIKREELDRLDLDTILIIAAVAAGVIVLVIILSVVAYKCTRPKATKKENIPPNL
ncbi:tissue factor [Sceloporus undulatus]|uniref:tissue factor n=1 Tax=Sceloporus undulatus TaxID=8520 RepID=UPI001C4C64A2|nr:tissue factor [Sceloporus undulatus]